MKSVYAREGLLGGGEAAFDGDHRDEFLQAVDVASFEEALLQTGDSLRAGLLGRIHVEALANWHERFRLLQRDHRHRSIGLTSGLVDDGAVRREAQVGGRIGTCA